jgi:hypothetical protein
MTTLSELVPMSIKGLMLDPVSNSPIVVLKDDDEKFFLPIWVGIFEANAIALQLENITTPRPMTHDLLRNMIAELDARVTRIVINDLKDSTFFAQIRLLINRPRAAHRGADLRRAIGARTGADHLARRGLGREDEALVREPLAGRFRQVQDVTRLLESRTVQ